MNARYALLIACISVLTVPAVVAEETASIGYHKQIRPIFQTHCQGCHQPAKDSGEYLMTNFESLVRGGESESTAIVAGKPDESYLVELIQPTDGEAEMPKGKKPRPADPKLKQLRDALTVASTPVPIPPDLAQLRRDADMSAAQLKNSRLTAAQDIAWALINNPAFLFNR